MITVSDIEQFKITGVNTEYYGGDQAWPQSPDFRNEAACGATTAANIFAYFVRRNAALSALSAQNADALRTKNGFSRLMEDVFPFIHPKLTGVMPPHFITGAGAYARERGITLHFETQTIPAARSKRPEDEMVADFIGRALRDDLPVAFLNLSNGMVKGLDSYHWVTIVAIESRASTSTAPAALSALIIDNGRKVKIDLGRWLKKSALGGAFVVVRAS